MGATAGGIIGRIRFGALDEPAALSEYLVSLDPPAWSLVRSEAFFFGSYEAADKLAMELHCFALVSAGHDLALREADRALNAEVSCAPAPEPKAAPAPAARPRRKPQPPKKSRLELLRRLQREGSAPAQSASAGKESDRLWYKQGAYE